MSEVAKYPTGIRTAKQKELYDAHYRDFVETLEGLMRALFALPFSMRIAPSNRGKEKMAAIHIVFSLDYSPGLAAVTQISKEEAAEWRPFLLPRFLDCADRINREFFISLINHVEID